MSKKENKEKKENNVTIMIDKFKEMWAIPQKRAGLKLLGYLVFFVVFLFIASVGSRMEKNNYVPSSSTTTTTTVDVDSYTYKQKQLLENKHFVNYEVKMGDTLYKISGSLSDGILDGYLESVDSIIKIKLKDDILYEVVKGNDVILESDINKDFINIKYIFKVISGARVFKETEGENRIYSYNMNNNVIKVSLNTEKIYKIEIIGDSFSYILSFDN